jgi:hypothetical protein
MSLRLLLGEKDTYTSIASCGDYVSRLRAKGGDASVKIYKGVKHGWFVPGDTNHMNPTAQNFRKCHVDEIENDTWVERESRIKTAENGVFLPDSHKRAISLLRHQRRSERIQQTSLCRDADRHSASGFRDPPRRSTVNQPAQRGAAAMMMKSILVCRIIRDGYGFSGKAQSLNGSYVSNAGNRIVISGGLYTYTQKPPETWRTTGLVQSTGDSVQFHGYLHYSRARQGTTLNCGARIWTKQ